jgi:Cu(I)/Ag(I) efflux system membrane fusion protein
MKVKQLYRYGMYATIFAVGLLLGRLIFGESQSTDAPQQADSAVESQVWTCSMHPQIRQDKPGRCPLCAMDLIPVKTASATGGTVDPDVILLSEEAVALANIRTEKVERRRPVREIRLYGAVKPDERQTRSLVAHVDGRIEQLNILFEGETVNEGDVIARIYSPDLLNAQQELLEALKMQPAQPVLIEAAREKLRRRKMTDAQIAAIERTGQTTPVTDVVANSGGTVLSRKVSQGDYVSQGSILFSLSDFASVWIVFDAYETDLPFLQPGDRVEYTLQALPGMTFQGKIAFIDPTLDKTTRTAKVRVETANRNHRLKPEMYARAIVKSEAGQGEEAIVIPKTAALWTGTRSLVYVKQLDSDQPAFRLRKVELGATLGDDCVVTSGLSEGEEIATSGAFVIDASAQLEGKRSMMNDGALLSAPVASSDHAEVRVGGLCEMCKERIEKAARAVKGVHLSEWDAESRLLHVQFDARMTSVDAVAQAVARAGHDAGQYKADAAVYNMLPDCCKYRE